MTWALLSAVFVASLLGSLHCAGMCGPFVAVYSAAGNGAAGNGAAEPAKRRRWNAWGPHLAYHGGRALTYVLLGTLAGAVGASIDWVGRSAGLMRIAALVSGVLVMLWGLSVLFPRLPWKSPLHDFLGRRLVRLRKKPALTRASLLGVFTPMLPCGWLYAFVVMSAGAGSPLGGATVMAAFWLGTVPALLGMGLVVGRLGTALRARMPVVTGVALIVLGFFAIVARSSSPLPALHAERPALTGMERQPDDMRQQSRDTGEQQEKHTLEVPGGEPSCH